MRKSQLDLQVAKALGKKKAEVSPITAQFLQVAGVALAEDGEVMLDGLGKLRVVEHKHTNKDKLWNTHGQLRLITSLSKFKVHFTKSGPLAKAIRNKAIRKKAS